MIRAHSREFDFLRQKIWRRALAALFDFASVFIAWHATIALRVALNPLMFRQLSRTRLIDHAPSAMVVLLLWGAVAAWLRLYTRRPGPRIGRQLRGVVNATCLLSGLLIAYAFFSRGIGADDFSRSFVLLFAPVSLFLLLTANYAVLAASASISRRFGLEERIAVAGDGPRADFVLRQLTRQSGPERFVGFIIPAHSRHRGRTRMAPVLGTTATVAEVINSARLDRIIVANGSLPADEATACLRVARRMGVVTAHALPGVLDDMAEASLGIRNGLAIVEVRPRPFSRRHDIAKRVFDVCVCGALLVLLLPLFVALAIAVRLSSPGPVLYVSDRVGRGGRHFPFYKFRTMYVGADSLRDRAGFNETDGHLFKIRCDPRVTRIGRLMRRFSLDELPQLFNVLLGNMSLVGPRPLPARDLDPDGCSRMFSEWAQARADSTPGVTCLWQIRGRSDLPFERMMELDLEYIRNWSLALELEILLETPLAVLSGRGAY